jgi:hypothetical protein
LRGSGFVGVLAVQTQAVRLHHRNPMLQRQLLDRRGLQLHATPGRSVGLRQHQRHVDARIQQRLQRHRSKFRRTGKNSFHPWPLNGGAHRARP